MLKYNCRSSDVSEQDQTRFWATSNSSNPGQIKELTQEKLTLPAGASSNTVIKTEVRKNKKPTLETFRRSVKVPELTIDVLGLKNILTKLRGEDKLKKRFRVNS